MRDKTLDILGFLSQSLLRERDLFYDAEEIWKELTENGYSEEEIERAIGYLERATLTLPGAFWSEDIPVHRSYTKKEMHHLTPKARGFLWMLKCKGVIDHCLEDEIVHKAMNLSEPAGVREIKTVAALTVFGYEHKTQVVDRPLYHVAESGLH
ncbi:MAG: DUF494 family protein [Deltaproteobacteria bacterium]|nr:DUF494 family protein [Deltaproteobacteria bacterium]